MYCRFFDNALASQSLEEKKTAPHLSAYTLSFRYLPGRQSYNKQPFLVIRFSHLYY